MKNKKNVYTCYLIDKVVDSALVELNAALITEKYTDSAIKFAVDVLESLRDATIQVLNNK